MTGSDKANWSILLLVGLADACWVGQANFRFSGVWLVLVFVAALLLVAQWCRQSPQRRSLGETAHYLAMWLALMQLVGILSYVAASLAAPLRDDEFVGLDAALGFDWRGVFLWVRAHPLFDSLLGLAYFSFLPQIFATIGYLALAGEDRGNREFLSGLLLSSIVVVAVSAALPALGPWSHFGVGVSPLIDHVPHVNLLRSGAAATFEIHEMKGIVVFPSFHTVAAFLLIYAHRRRRWLFIASLVLNGALLLSVVPIGGHYLVDLIAGAVVAALTLAALRGARRASPARADALLPDSPFELPSRPGFG